MFQTSLFAEVYPQNLSKFPLMLCQIVYPLAIWTALCSALLFFAAQFKKLKMKNQIYSNTYSNLNQTSIEKGNRYEALFLSAGYFAFLLSFIAFSLKYPYTCSSDFRYIVICLIYIAIGLADSSRLYTGMTRSAFLSRIIRIGVYTTLFLSSTIYMFWNQW